MEKKILLTGSSGFVGQHILTNLTDDLELVINEIVRDDALGENQFLIPNINSVTNWLDSLDQVDCVIHLAAIAHEKNKASNIDKEFKEVNTFGSLNLAEQAASVGVKRFIFISSIGVNGLSTKKPFRHNDSPNPQEPYAISKYEAEIGLKEISDRTGMDIVIIRPPLVYGANAPGNFGKFAALAKKNFPLPLGAINNKRSLVGIDNLVDLIALCVNHPKAANQTFLVSDDYDVSTSYLLKSMIISADKTPFLLSVPVGFLRFVAGVVGKGAVIDRMASNLQVDISHTKDTLDWEPPVSFKEGIRRCFK